MNRHSAIVADVDKWPGPARGQVQMIELDSDSCKAGGRIASSSVRPPIEASGWIAIGRQPSLWILVYCWAPASSPATRLAEPSGLESVQRSTARQLTASVAEMLRVTEPLTLDK